MQQMRFGLLALLAKLFRCLSEHVVIMRFYAGSTIVEFTVTTDMTSDEAIDVINNELANPQSELASLYGGVAGSFDASPADMESETPVPTIAANVRAPSSTKSSLLVAMLVSGTVVCLGLVGAALFVWKRRKNAKALSSAAPSPDCAASKADKYGDVQVTDVEVIESETAPLSQPTPQPTPQVRAFEYTQTWREMKAMKLDEVQFDETTPALTPMEAPMEVSTALRVPAHPCSVLDE